MAEAKRSSEKMPSAVPNRSRTITPDEVKRWISSSRTRAPSDAICEEIASFLTKMRWPGDPPPDPNSPWLPKVEIDEGDSNQWWDDIQGVAKAANELLASIPAMVTYWEGPLSPAPR